MIKRVAAVMIAVCALMITAHEFVVTHDHECVISHEMKIVVNDESILCAIIAE